MAGIRDIFNSYTLVDALDIDIPKYDEELVPNAMIEQGNLATKVQNLRTRVQNSPVFKGWTSSGNIESPSYFTIPTPNKQEEKTTVKTPATTSKASLAKDFIKQQESFRSTRYKDAGKTSIGYGFYGDTYWKGNEITEEQADKVLDGILEDQEKILSKYDIWKSLNDNQKAALHSYMYNVGSGHFSKNSEMGKALDSGDLRAIHDAINISTSQGKRSEGLIRRRDLERQLFAS